MGFGSTRRTAQRGAGPCDQVATLLAVLGEYVALGDAATSAVAFAARELLAFAPKDEPSAAPIDALALAAKVRRSTAEAAADELVDDDGTEAARGPMAP